MRRHLIGIGGVGMSALATALLRLGDEVTGSDRNLDTPNIRFLESLGIRCLPDDGSLGTSAKEKRDEGFEISDLRFEISGDSNPGQISNLKSQISNLKSDSSCAFPDEVIVSTAIEETNRDLVRARELGIPVVHRAVALARALAPYRLVAVVGTCGKSTVTAMLGHILAECGLDPMCVNGANVPGWEGAVRFGRGAFAVAEVDESDRSLVAFKPYAALVTNASADHYSKEEMDAVFDAFTADVPGPVIDGREGGRRKEEGGSLDKTPTSYFLLPTCIPMPGKHNRENAALALRMARALGCDEAKARAALATFRGVERRLQRHGARVYDDYAHNPEKLRAMWTTLAEAHPEGGVCVVWRPHGYAPLRKMLDALAAMFNETVRAQDKLLLLPVYDAGGTTDRSLNSDALAARLRPGSCVLVPDHAAAQDWIARHLDAYAVFATCGARDPDLPALASRLAALV